MTGLTHIHQCPRCELRFTSTSELQDHLSNDHRPRTHVEDKPASVITPPVAPAAADPAPRGSATAGRQRRVAAILLVVAAATIVLVAFYTSTSTLLIVIGLVLALIASYGWRARIRRRYHDVYPSAHR